MPDDDDQLDGCELDFADPAVVTQDGEQLDALLMFADIPWVGETTDSEGNTVPQADPDLVAQRVEDLRALNQAGG